jgi:hypothetical protein
MLEGQLYRAFFPDLPLVAGWVQYYDRPSISSALSITADPDAISGKGDERYSMVLFF